MANLGSFQKQDDGSIIGVIKSFALSTKTVVLRPVGRTDDQAPDFRIYDGPIECGAAWKRTSHGAYEYLSVKLHGPSFPAPIYANLVEERGGYTLVRSRGRRAV